MTSGVLNHLTHELKRAQSLIDASTYDEARQVLASALAETRKRNIQSAHLHWLLGVAADYQGDLEAAVHHFQEALRLDPIAPPFQRSRELVHARVSALLHDHSRKPDAEDTPKLYELLKMLGPVAGETHLVMARFLQAKGEVGRALELVRAVLLLDESPAAAALADELASPLAGGERSANASGFATA